MKKVSVIVPVYNVEDYVEKCIDSILNQTYKNIELIIIDDNSTDSSYEKILKYNDKAKIYQNKQNKGLSYTRNLGISKVTGDYVSFIDHFIVPAEGVQHEYLVTFASGIDADHDVAGRLEPGLQFRA